MGNAAPTTFVTTKSVLEAAGRAGTATWSQHSRVLSQQLQAPPSPVTWSSDVAGSLEPLLRRFSNE